MLLSRMEKRFKLQRNQGRVFFGSVVLLLGEEGERKKSEIGFKALSHLQRFGAKKEEVPLKNLY